MKLYEKINLTCVRYANAILLKYCLPKAYVCVYIYVHILAILNSS